ncbi:dynactin subunit 6-like [Rhopilema esculentum]|uniref:dynactin subunit 6-like n=1 Tax=Rhopilema esculentum TaxID=499914 RepID=UPI0031D7C0ED|eukprot:gene1147-15497_t
MASKASSKIRITPGAVVCQEAEIKGEVTIAARTVVHPKARIIAEHGSIIIGEGNLIEEQTLIWNSTPGKTMVIGNYNVFEIGCISEALAVGNNNVLEAKCKVGPLVELGDGCVIGNMCRMDTKEKLSNNTVIYGQNANRRKASEIPAPQTLQLDFLTKILPNYHHLKKPFRQ